MSNRRTYKTDYPTSMPEQEGSWGPNNTPVDQGVDSGIDLLYLDKFRTSTDCTGYKQPDILECSTRMRDLQMEMPETV